MPLFRERQIFPKAVKVLVQFGHNILRTHRFVAAQSLALLVDTEDFITHRANYYTHADLEKLIELKETILVDLMSDFDNRKTIRPLVDCIDKAKRQARSK